MKSTVRRRKRSRRFWRQCRSFRARCAATTTSCRRRFSFWPRRTRLNSKEPTPCPEAQLDRFLFNVILDYLSAEDETKVIDLTTTTRNAQVQPVTNAEEILEFQRLVRMVPIAESVGHYVVRLVRATRQNSGSAPDFVKKYVNYGASVRAAQFIVLAAKARALSRHRFHVSYEDVKTLAIPVLRHRILLNFHAESDRIDSDEIFAPPDRGRCRRRRGA